MADDQAAARSTDLVALGGAALATFVGVGHRWTPADADRPTPCREFTVADLLAHLERSMVLLAGCADASLDADGNGPSASRVVDLAEAALAAWARRGFDGAVQLGSRALPATDVHAIVLLELTVHAHDLAAALGTTAADPPAVLVEYLQERVPVLITPDRRGQAFAPPVEIGASASPFEQLLAFTGRQPTVRVESSSLTAR